MSAPFRRVGHGHEHGGRVHVHALVGHVSVSEYVKRARSDGIRPRPRPRHRVIFVSIATMRVRSILAFEQVAGSTMPSTAATSKTAPHSSAEPRAIDRNRARAAAPFGLAHDSAMLSGIDVAARLSWSRRSPSPRGRVAHTHR